MFVFITNNTFFKEKYGEKFNVLFEDVSHYDIFVIIRDKIHKGGKLKSHPLAGNINPKISPYRTVLMEFNDGVNVVDMESLMLIEEAIGSFDRHTGIEGLIPEKTLEDYRLIDVSVIESFIHQL